MDTPGLRYKIAVFSDPAPGKSYATTYEQMGSWFLSNPAPGESLLSGNLVMQTGCIITTIHGIAIITTIHRIAIITIIHRIAIITTIHRIAIITTIHRIAILTTIHRIAIITTIPKVVGRLRRRARDRRGSGGGPGRLM